MGQSKIVTIGLVFILSDVFYAVTVVIAKAPYKHCTATARENALPCEILLASLSCQTPEISWPRYSALLFLAIESLTIHLVDYFSTLAKELQGISFWYLLQDHRNSLCRFPDLLFVAQTRSAFRWIHAVHKDFFIFLRQTRKLRRLHRVNARYIPKTFSPHKAKWVVSQWRLESFILFFAVLLPYLTRKLISNTRLHNFLS